ncbi:MAG: peptidylprolyl isomerase [Holophagaceae bacterium]|nr:peptidylprolyl isomerase [Holophagaceae bacterium]
MLRDFRNVFKSRKELTGGLMIVLSFGLLAYLGTAFQTTHPDSPEVVVARVYGRDIRRRELSETMERMIQQFGRQENMDAILPYIQQQAFGQLVNLRLTEELAQRHGVIVTDIELRDAIASELRSYPFMLDKNGQLLPAAEIRALLAQAFRITLKTFEDNTRSRLIMNKLYEQAATVVPVDEEWITEEYRARNEKVSLEYIALTPDDSTVEDPGDTRLEEYLKLSGDRFQVGARRVLQMVSVDQGLFGNSLAPNEEVLKSAFESKKNSYLELHASHILIQGTTPEELKIAEEKLLKIRARIMAGADFARVAENESEDPSAKANRGDLGWFRDGVMDKGFWDGAVELKKGEVSKPVQSQFGLHLIKMIDRKDKTFEEAKSELMAEILNERFSAKAKEKLEQLRKRVGERGDLSAAAVALGLQVSTSEPFASDSSEVTGLENLPYLVSEAFSMKVGQVSQIISAPNSFVVYRVQRELPIAVPPLKEIRAKVLDAFRMEESRRELLAKFAQAGEKIQTLGQTEKKSEYTFTEITELADNSLARHTILGTPVGSVTKPVWTNDGKLWGAIIRERIPAEPLASEKRMELVKEIQSKESSKLLYAELDDLRIKGASRRGFSSLWGRFNGIYVNENALKRPSRGDFY